MLPELTDNEVLRSIWAALRRIEDNLALPPAPLELPVPVVHVPAPDLADVVNAVTALQPGPSAEQIARALADVLAPALPASQGADALGEVARALEKLDFRLKGMGTQAYGGGSVTLQPGQTVGVSNWGEMPTSGGLTNTELRATPVPVSGTVSVGNLPASQAVTNPHLSNLTGAWGYYAGVAGTVAVAAGRKVTGIAAHATVAGSLTIDGGPSVPIPANSQIAIAPLGNLVAPSITFTGTDSYFVEALA